MRSTEFSCGSWLTNLAYVKALLRYDIPKCHKKMILQIGLAPDTSNNVLECPGCQNTLVPLVPGPIVGGPFSVDA